MPSQNWLRRVKASLTSLGTVSVPLSLRTSIAQRGALMTRPTDKSQLPTDVPCPVSGPLQIHMKSGVSQYWFSAQVVNANRRTTKLEVSINQGQSWKGTTRQTYNFFEISSGVGASTAWIRVTSESGSQVVVKNVPMQSDAIVKAGQNYG